jgi:hypothetical protein
MLPRRLARLASGLAGVALLALSSACATSRGTLDVRVPAVASSQGPAVKIVSVTDRRTFEREPSDPSTPSLKGGEIEDRSITSRAIARKRNSYGQALGDILLPEGRTVELVGEEALTRGLNESGYRVLREGEDGYDAAVPLQGEILQFWSWFSPGFWAAHLEFASRIRLSGPIEPLGDGEEFSGYVRLGTSAATGRAWLNTINQGLDKLNEDMKTRLGASAIRRDGREGAAAGAGDESVDVE